METAFNAVAMFGPSTDFIDMSGLNQFLRQMGHRANKSELAAIVRRIDLDGNDQVDPVEFAESFTLYKEPV